MDDQGQASADSFYYWSCIYIFSVYIYHTYFLFHTHAIHVQTHTLTHSLTLPLPLSLSSAEKNKNRTGMEDGESSTASDDTTLETVAIVTGAVSTVFLVVAVSVSISFLYCYCCERRGDRERTEDVECGEASPSPVASIGPVAFQPQGEGVRV